MTADTDLFKPEPKEGDPLFSGSPSPSDPDKKFLDILVGEGKKYADIEALAESRVHADNHINQLERDNEELRQELQKRLGAEEMIERIRQESQNPNPSNQDETNSPGEPGDGTKVSLDDVRSLVQEAVGEHINTEQQNQNKRLVMSELQKRLGPNFAVEMRKRAEALGESTDDLTKLAISKPRVFLELMAPEGSRPAPSVDPSLPRNVVNSTVSDNASGVRNQTYYNSLRESDPEKYHSKNVRVQMMNDALALGEAFFN